MHVKTLKTHRVGDIEIVALSDGVMKVSYRSVFPDTPASVWEGYRERFPDAYDSDGFLTNIGVFLIRSAGKITLVDTGLGPDGSPQGAMDGRFGPPELLTNLQAIGVRHEEIDNVFLTHLHGDHIGWNLLPDGRQWRPTFPKARYLLQQADWDHFASQEELAKLEANVRVKAESTYLPLMDLGVLELIEGDADVAPGLQALHTPGHTPGHMSMFISSGNDRALIIGDVLGSPMHASEPDQVYLPDSNVNQARETRHRLLDMAESDGMVILGSHMTQPGWGTIVRWRGKRFWQGI